MNTPVSSLYLSVRRLFKATSVAPLLDLSLGSPLLRASSVIAVIWLSFGFSIPQANAVVSSVTSASATGFNVTSVTIANTTYSGADLIGSTASIVRDTVSGSSGTAIVGWVFGTAPQLASSQADANAASSGLDYRSGSVNVLAGSAFQFGRIIKPEDQIFVMDFGSGDAFTAQLISSTGAPLGSALSIGAGSFGGSLFSWPGGINIIGTNNTVGTSATSQVAGVAFQLSDFGSGITTATGIKFTVVNGLDPVMVGLGAPVNSHSNAFNKCIFPTRSGVNLWNQDMGSAPLNLVRDGGFKIARKGIYWNEIEPQVGVYNWTQTDQWVSDMESRGLTMLLILVWNNRLYENIWDRAIVTAAGRQAFANFAATVASRYSAKNIIWEIWNEPNEAVYWHTNPDGSSNTNAMAAEYTALVQAAVPAMKAADPDCYVAAGSIANLWNNSFNWFSQCAALGILTSGIDVVSVHPYGFSWPELAMQGGYPGLRGIFTYYGLPNMPIITSEVGYSDTMLLARGVASNMVEEEQAWHFVRQNLVDAMSNVGLTTWFSLTGGSYGVLENNLTPRLTYYAAQVMNLQLANYAFKERLALSSDLDYAAVFENSLTGDLKLVAWTVPSASDPVGQQLSGVHTSAIPVGIAGNYTVVDTWGSTTTVTASGNVLNLTISGAPVYVPLQVKGSPASYRNVALGKPVTADSFYTDSASSPAFSYPPKYAVDGDTQSIRSRWVSANNSSPHWIEIDLKDTFSINMVRFWTGSGFWTGYNNAYNTPLPDYQIQRWDGSQWVNIVARTGNTSSKVVESFGAVTTSKVRLLNSPGIFVRLYEIEIYGVRTVGAINFNYLPVSSFGGSQDAGTVNVADAGNALQLKGNAWKKIDFPYSVTPQTVLEFDFKSTSQAEIQGIGFGADNNISATKTFQLYGTQQWGIQAFKNYTNGSGWKRYRIPVGQYYTGSMLYLTFTNNNDANPQNGDGCFANVTIHE